MLKMRYLLFTLFTLLITNVIARPHPEEQKQSEAEETEYDANDEAPAEDTAEDEEEPRLNDQDPSDSRDEEATSRQQVRLGRERYQQRQAAELERDGRGDFDSFSDNSRSSQNQEKLDDAEQSSNDFSSLARRRQSNRYIDNSDVNDPPENVHLTNYKTNRVQGDNRNNELDKRTVDSIDSSVDDSDALFENNRENRNDGNKAEYNNVAGSHEQAQRLKQFYNTMESEHKSMLGDRGYDLANRDRRQAEQKFSLLSTSTEKGGVANLNHEEDEAAIKRHIHKLSGEELEELLNSLSDDKKALLTKIIESDSSTYETLNKREITKKAGAVEDNGYMDSSFSEISKVQGASVDINTNSAVSPTAELENGKQESQTESGEISNTKTSEATRAETCESKAPLSAQAVDTKLDSSLNILDVTPDSSDIQSKKRENKRETNLDLTNYSDDSVDDSQLLGDADDSFDDQDIAGSQSDDFSQLMDEEAQLYGANEHQYKREAVQNQADLDSIKSLEESFPNSNGDGGGKYFESNMAPLVRVKRTDEGKDVKKRAAIDLPEPRVAYVPYKAENDDEDNEEGSEFDDEGFYDRTSNYAKNNDKTKNVALDYVNRSLKSKESKPQRNVKEESNSDDASDDKIESDTMSLGSDTDSVLSGVEGVDDNLMYNSGARKRRTAGDDDGQLDAEKQGRPLRSKPADQPGKHSDDINLPNYQENDGFGPLPRGYDAELSRYKRIRRVKPSTADVNVSDK